MLLTNKPTEERRSKYELQHLVRVNLAGQDRAYRCVYQLEDENGEQAGGLLWIREGLGPGLGSAWLAETVPVPTAVCISWETSMVSGWGFCCRLGFRVQGHLAGDVFVPTATSPAGGQKW